MTETVFVTGATGFIAKHLILQLLNKGYLVVGGARSVSRREEIISAISPHLNDLADLESRLRVVELDLTQDQGWNDALQGCSILMHTASPFPLEEPKNEDELIRPAVDGTLRALRAAHQCSIKRVVLTSSVVAISSCELPPGKTAYDEDDWSDTSGPLASAYGKSKTLAEQAAWEFVKTQAPEMKLTTINPGFVLGPTLDDKFGSSMKAINRLLQAKDPALPDIGFTIVDVRDVAQMHIRAAESDDAVGLRIAAVGGFETFVGMAKILKGHLPNQKIVTRQAPNFLIRLLALFDKQIRTIVPTLGRRDTVSNERAKAVLGMTFIPTRQSVTDAADSVIANQKG